MRISGLFITLIVSVISCMAQTESVEMILKSNGDMVEAHSKNQTRNRWGQRLIRGTSGKSYYLLVDSLYNKYFYRVIKTPDVFRDTVAVNGMNRRDHQISLGWTIEEPNKFRAFDIPKVSIEENINQAWIDILNTSIADSVRNDEIEDVPEWERWEFGTRERKEFIIMRYENLTITEVDSYLTEIDTIIVIPGQTEPDTTRRVPRLNMPVSFLRDSLIVLGKSLDSLSLREFLQDPMIPGKLQGYFNRNIIGKGQGRGFITLDTFLGKLLTENIGDIPFIWLRHPVFKNRIKRKWLKK